MKLSYKIFTLSLLVGCIKVASADPITLINQGFETGDLTGWDSLGDVIAAGPTDIITFNQTLYSISPKDTTMAYLNSQGATVAEIESFLGIGTGSLFDASLAGIDFPNEFPDEFPTGLTDELPDLDDEMDINALTNGSAISQRFMAEAGDTIDMSWNYVARDYVPYTDPSFAVLVAPDGTSQVEVLASTTGPGIVTGSDGISGVFTFAQELNQTGEYTIGFAVTNAYDTGVNAALFIDDGVSACDPACNAPGSPENPLLPDEDTSSDSFDFTFTVSQIETPIFIDPEVAIGYEYIVNSGPNVASVILPDLGDGLYDIYGWDGLGYNDFLGNALANIDFAFGANGLDRFQVLGIEVSEMLDPDDPLAFVTGLTFVDVGEVDLSQIPISIDVPSNEIPTPQTAFLFMSGLVTVTFMRRRFIFKQGS